MKQISIYLIVKLGVIKLRIGIIISFKFRYQRKNF